MLTYINYPIDKEKMLKIAEDARKYASAYKHPIDKSRPILPNWKSVHGYDSDYGRQIMRDMEVIGRIDFYFHAPNTDLLPHVDPKCRCSINFVLSGADAPVTFHESLIKTGVAGGASVDYYYEQAVLNTFLPHSVKSSDTERILFKICILNESYESVVSRIPYIVK
jgi:hypothetical protein